MDIAEAAECLNGPVYWPAQIGLIRNREQRRYDRDQHSRATPVIRSLQASICLKHEADFVGESRLVGRSWRPVCVVPHRLKLRLERSRKARWVHGFYSAEEKQRRRIERQEVCDLIRKMRQALSDLYSRPDFPS
jgi:hypothetical protein